MPSAWTIRIRTPVSYTHLTDIPIDVRACDFSGITPDYLSDVCALAQKNEIIIACLGEPSNLSGEAVSTAKIELPDQQMRLLKALKTTGKKIIVVLFLSLIHI